jgi:hypothetical protein
MSGIVFAFHLLQFLQVKPGIFGWPQFLQAVTCARAGAFIEARRRPCRRLEGQCLGSAVMEVL